MTWKEFFKPNWKKIITFTILIAITFIPSFYFSGAMSLSNAHGFPLFFYYCVPTTSDEVFYNTDCSFYIIALLIDLFVLYLLACLIVWIYNKNKKNTVRKKK